MQRFLLSAKARTLSLRTVFGMGEEKAYETFRKLRWSETDGDPVCPRCGCLDTYGITSRRKFKCASAECHHQFSVTSGTIFASRKMSFTDLLAAICIFTNAVKGISALQLARDLDCQHKTAFVLAHKLREAMAAETKGLVLSGEVEIDGMYIGGHIRPANRVEDRIDRRLAEHQTGTRRVVIAARQRKGRTLTFVVRSEAEGVEFVNRVADRSATIHADEASHWDVLHATFPVSRINHSEAYCADGACTNQAESFFSRLRRMIEGQHHHASPQYLHRYAAEAAWKEDHRRLDNGALAGRALRLAMLHPKSALAGRALRLAMLHPKSREWCGYWQRGK